MTLSKRQERLDAYIEGKPVRISPIDLFPDVTPRGAFLVGTHGVTWGVIGELFGRLTGQPIGIENSLLVAGVLAGAVWGVVNEELCRMVVRRFQSRA